MPKRGITSGQIGVRCNPETVQTLEEIESKHGVEPVKLARGLIEAACQFYRQWGWFSFPVVIYPEKFQAQYVAEHQAAYGGAASPPASRSSVKSAAGTAKEKFLEKANPQPLPPTPQYPQQSREPAAGSHGKRSPRKA